MQSFSYILSPTVASELQRIEETRRKILLELVSEKLETELRFDNLVRTISSSLLLSGRSCSDREILSALRDSKKSEKSAEIISVKKAYDFLRHYCHLTGNVVSTVQLQNIFSILSPGEKINEQKLKTLVDFINVSEEHPVVQAGLCFAILEELLPENNDSIKIISIISEAFAYNQGYDFRGMLNLQEFFFSDLLNLKNRFREAKRNKNLTEFIEYFVQAFSIQAEKGYTSLKERSPQNVVPTGLKNLNERQIKILDLFEIPDTKISNKLVQKEFGVSQITASRDLAKLAILGLIFQRGHGRSIYYVKI